MARLKRPPVFRKDGTIEIRLTRGYVAIIDAEDAHLAAFNWFALTMIDGQTYAARNTPVTDRPGQKQTLAYLHREVLGAPSGSAGKVDHMDGDTMNCRRGNLRAATNADNSRNIGLPRSNKSGFLGVYFSKAKGKWRAQINKKKIGWYATAEAANEARLRAEQKLWGIQPRRAEAHAAAAARRRTG